MSFSKRVEWIQENNFRGKLYLLAILLLLAGCWSSEEDKLLRDAKPFYDAANTAYRENQIEEALTNVRKAIEIYPNYVKAHILYQELMLKENSPRQLISEYHALLAKNLQSPLYHYLYGRLLSDLDMQYEEYKKAEDLDANFPWAHYGLGWAYFKRKQFDEAIQEFEEAIRIDPTNAMFYNNLGAVYFFKGQYDEAIQELKKSVELDPDYATPYNNLAWAYYKKGDFKMAEDMLEKFINRAPAGSTKEIAKEKLLQLRGR